MIRSNLSAKRILRFVSIALVIVGSSNTHASADTLVAVPTEAVSTPANLDIQGLSRPPSNVHLTFALNSVAAQNAGDFVPSLYDPKSPNYHKWLTPQQYGAKFGAASDDVAAVVNYLTHNGFTSVNVWPNRLFISAQIGLPDAERLFHVTVGSYHRSASEVARGFSPTFYAPDTEPTIDSSVASRLTGLFGLSNAAERKPNFVRPMLPPSEANGGLNPSDLSQIYHGAALHNAGYYGGGETIAIFSPTGYNQSDINNFLSANDITGANISIVNVNGGATDFSSEEEACLDIETVVGQASAATIKVYEGPNDGSLDIFNQMASDDPNIVTESYGADENSVTASFAASYETLRSQMAAEGISILVASGDNGAYDSSYQSTVTTSVDATSAYVTSVGGTELQPYIGDIWNGEIAWTYNDGTLGTNAGSGGGLSIYYAQPSWQTGPGVANGSSNGMRQIPDISSLASTPYYSIYALGAFAAYGGTSAACQFTGGTLALIEEQLGGGRLGNIDPALYGSGNNDAAIYHDITSGNNGIYSCTPNWDFVTGWGSVDFAKLALGMLGTNISSSPVTTFGSGLQMFSVPFTFSNGATPAELLSGMVTSAGYPAYSVAVWKPTADTYELSPSSPANSIVPGQGYWARFDSSSGGALPAIGTPVTVATYSVSLASGWNMIGNPYLTSVPINSLQVTSNGVSNSFSAAVTAGVLQPILYDYNGTIYVAHTSGDSLNPYDGYWIDSNEACTLTFSSP